MSPSAQDKESNGTPKNSKSRTFRTRTNIFARNIERDGQFSPNLPCWIATSVSKCHSQTRSCAVHFTKYPPRPARSDGPYLSGSLETKTSERTRIKTLNHFLGAAHAVSGGLMVFLQTRSRQGSTECRIFEQSAKFLFRNVMVRANPGVRAIDRLVVHGQSLQPNDAQVDVASFPDLALLQFHLHDSKTYHNWAAANNTTAPSLELALPFHTTNFHRKRASRNARCSGRMFFSRLQL